MSGTSNTIFAEAVAIAIFLTIAVVGPVSSVCARPSPQEDAVESVALESLQEEAVTSDAQVAQEVVADPEIEKLLQAALEESQMPGIVAAIATVGEPIQMGAAGIRKFENDSKITINDTMHLGSCTKAITAALAGRLIDQGKLSMDQTIGELLPDVAAEIHEDFAAVTLRQLMEMRGSVPPTMKWWMQKGESITEKRKLVAIESMNEKPEHPPGTHEQYTNLSFMLAGLMCQAAGGKSWEELVEQEIFAPLGITSGGFGVPGTDDVLDQPWGHRVQSDGTLFPVRHDNSPTLGPAGTVHMNLADWSTFLMEMTDAAPKQLLSEEIRIELTTPSENADAYACGWIVTERPWADGKAMWHNGSNTFWYALTWIGPKKGNAFMIVTNVHSEEVMEQVGALMNMLVALDSER